MMPKKDIPLQAPSIIHTSFKFGLTRLHINSANCMHTSHTVLYSWHSHVSRWFISWFIGFQPSKVMRDFFRNHPRYHCIHISSGSQVPPNSNGWSFDYHHVSPLNYGLSSFSHIFPIKRWLITIFPLQLWLFVRCSSSISRGPKTAALDTRTCSDLGVPVENLGKTMAKAMGNHRKIPW